MPKKLQEITLLVVVILLVLISVTVNMAPHLGFLISDIGSGSMSPTLNMGTMVIASRVDPAQLKAGDIIVFQPASTNTNYICHRITQVLNTTPVSFQTKGDNYPKTDPDNVSAGSVFGKVNYHIEAVGYFIQFIRSSIGLTLCLIIPSLILIWLCARSILHEIMKLNKAKIKSEEQA